MKRSLLPALLALALALRLLGLGTWSFWNDEIATVQEARRLFAYDGARRYPVNYLLTAATINVLGESEFSARLLPALWGTAQIGLLYAFGSALGGRFAGGLAALLLALHPYHIFWSQNARHYALLSLLLLGVLYFLLRPPARWAGQKYLWVAVLFLLALGTHTTALLALPGLLLILPRLNRRVLIAGAIALVALAAVIASWGPLRAVTVERFQAGRSWGGDAVHLAAAACYYYHPGLLLAALCCWWKGDRATAAQLLLWILFPLTVIVFLTRFGDVSFAYAAYTLPALILLAARGVTRCSRPVLVAGLLVLGMLPPLYWYYDSFGQRAPLKNAARLIDALQANDPVKYVYTSHPRTLPYYLRTPVRGVGDDLLTDDNVAVLVDADFAKLDVTGRWQEHLDRAGVELTVWKVSTPVRNYSLTLYVLPPRPR